MKEGASYTSEEALAMGYDPAVVDFFKKFDSRLLEFMWGNRSAHYKSILKNNIETDTLIRDALSQVRLEGRIGTVGLSSLLMAEFRLTHPQTPASRGEEKSDQKEAAAEILASFKEQAEYHKNHAASLVESGQSLDDPHSSAATNKRMGEVYEATEKELEPILKQFRRNLERAMNPNFKDYTDPEINLVIERFDRTSASINDHHGALT